MNKHCHISAFVVIQNNVSFENWQEYSEVDDKDLLTEVFSTIHLIFLKFKGII